MDGTIGISGQGCFVEWVGPLGVSGQGCFVEWVGPLGESGWLTLTLTLLESGLDFFGKVDGAISEGLQANFVSH